MKINDNAFQRMNNGLKVREYRINDDKRRKVKISTSCLFFICFYDNIDMVNYYER